MNMQATNAETGLTVKVGDTVTVAAQGIKVTGEVAVVHHWGKMDSPSYPHSGGWDIEIDKANVPGGYSRWKQWEDGGQIVVLNGVAYDGEVAKFRISDKKGRG